MFEHVQLHVQLVERSESLTKLKLSPSTFSRLGERKVDKS